MTLPGLGPVLQGPAGEQQAATSSRATSPLRGQDGARPSPTAEPDTSPTTTTTSTADEGTQDDRDDARRRRELEAATSIQRRWKGHKTRAEHADVKLSSDERWKQLLFNAEGVKRNEDADQGKNAPEQRWHRALHASKQLQNGKAFESGSGDQIDDASKDGAESPALETRPPAKQSKALEEQHVLEMLDGRHRYGSNLKWYHKAWEADDDTRDNFFRWLDRGAGKDLSLPECSREQLEKERITYLSIEQRLNYYVTVDRKDGRLRWYKNGQHVDTAPRTWVDAGPDVGIVPKDDAYEDEEEQDARSSSDASSDLSDEAEHYAGKDHSSDPVPISKVKTFFEALTVKGATDKVLRKTVGNNTWIYVCDTRGHVFVGIKMTGAFQHSSFLSGGRVSAAGLITARHGIITSLSPLSGHYRTNINHFKEFLKQMEEQGADLSRVHATKAELTLFGLEKFGKLSKSVGKVKKSILHPHAAAVDREKARELEEEKDAAKAETKAQADERGAAKRSLSDFRRDILYGRKRTGPGQTLQNLAQKVTSNGAKDARSAESEAQDAAIVAPDTHAKSEIVPPLSDAPRPRINGPDDL